MDAFESVLKMLNRAKEEYLKDEKNYDEKRKKLLFLIGNSSLFLLETDRLDALLEWLKDFYYELLNKKEKNVSTE